MTPIYTKAETFIKKEDGTIEYGNFADLMNMDGDIYIAAAVQRHDIGVCMNSTYNSVKVTPRNWTGLAEARDFVKGEAQVKYLQEIQKQVKNHLKPTAK